jgi:NTP pyrophosphatase (non-canonical NTP hydrolase)
MSAIVDNYQERAHTTAIYPEERGVEYTVLGLCSEIGEIAGKIKKQIRDGSKWNGEQLEDYRKAVLHEVGDVLWYVAELCTTMGIKFNTVVYAARSFEVPPVTNVGLSLRLILTCSMLASVALAHAENGTSDELKEAVTQMLIPVVAGVRRMCEMYNADIEIVMTLNLGKLEARAQAGTLGGNGDNR